MGSLLVLIWFWMPAEWLMESSMCLVAESSTFPCPTFAVKTLAAILVQRFFYEVNVILSHKW